jgi:hypothetical protein
MYYSDFLMLYIYLLVKDVINLFSQQFFYKYVNIMFLLDFQCDIVKY